MRGVLQSSNNFAAPTNAQIDQQRVGEVISSCFILEALICKRSVARGDAQNEHNETIYSFSSLDDQTFGLLDVWGDNCRLARTIGDKTNDSTSGSPNVRTSNIFGRLDDWTFGRSAEACRPAPTLDDWTTGRLDDQLRLVVQLRFLDDLMDDTSTRPSGRPEIWTTGRLDVWTFS